MATGSTVSFVRQRKKSLLLAVLPQSCLYSCFFLTLFCFLLSACVLKPVNAVAVTKTGAASIDDHCVVVLDSSAVVKQIGSVWKSSGDPCAIHACEKNEVGQAYEKITVEDCEQFYCDVDSELRAQEGTCCGVCVRNKCRYKDKVFEIGQTWHNSEDCTLYECTQLTNGEPMINAYKKTCPDLPADCDTDQIYIKDCCQYCNDNSSYFDDIIDGRSGVTEIDEDIWTEEFYRNHECVRECKLGEPPKTCYYTFVVEWYQTLSKACYDCPANTTDCVRPHCITADGVSRSITVVNRMMPGPSVEVCQHDNLVVDVKNYLLGESTTIHFHGLHQKDTPYMDGVPHITQCPISPHATFRYSFKADLAGTHFWHSHTGMQRGDGVYGAFIVRRPRANDPHAHLYDFDLLEHKMMVQDWVHETGVSMFASHHHSRGDNKPYTLLINGRGRYYPAIWAKLKEQHKSRSRNFLEVEEDMPSSTNDKTMITTSTIGTITTTTSTMSTTKSTTGMPEPLPDNDTTFLHASNNNQSQTKESNEILTLARLTSSLLENFNTTLNVSKPMVLKPVTMHKTAAREDLAVKPLEISKNSNNFEQTLSRSKRDTEFKVDLNAIPLQVYTVQSGFRYRFRIINAEFLNCPIAISIDNHTLTAISSDGYDFEAVEVGSIVTYAGERFDFIVNANQSIGNYWVRLKGLMDCSEEFTSAFQVAIFRYEGAAEEEPTEEIGWQHNAEGIELNAMNRGSGYPDSLTIAELNALPAYDKVPGVDRDALKPVADYKFFIYYDFYAKDNPSFHKKEYYGFHSNLSRSNQLYTPQLNHISLKFPSVALLAARDEIDDSLFCNETSLATQGTDCRKEFCSCHHVLQVPLNSIVEFIIIDEGFTYDANHPFHLHGNAFRVVGLERLGSNVTVDMIKQLDQYNLLKRNLVRPPVKDTVTVPDGGYTIIRFEAYNPGFWLFHCHIEFHAEIGMALVLKVGDNDEMVPVPKNFPTCHDYMPSMMDEVTTVGNADIGVGNSNSNTTDGSNAAATYRSSGICWTFLLPFIYIIMQLNSILRVR